jgi:hypothetical protein
MKLAGIRRVCSGGYGDNSDVAHPQLSHNGFPMDGAPVDVGSNYPYLGDPPSFL